MSHLVSRLFRFLWSLAAPVFPWLLWSDWFWRVLVRYFVQFSSICVWCFLVTDWDDTFAVKTLSYDTPFSEQSGLALLCFPLLPFADIVCFTNWRFVGTCIKQVYRNHFSAAFPHGASVSHFGNSCSILTFSLLLCLIRWSVINDHWCYYYELMKSQMMVRISLAIFLN